jgi:hypothetical protein
MSTSSNLSPPPEVPVRPRPDPLAAIFKIVAGLALMAATVYLVTLHDGQRWNTPSASSGAVSGFALGLGVWALLSFVAQLRGRSLGKGPGIAALVLCMLAGGIAEPRFIQARRVSGEAAAWAELQASPKRYADYQRYERSTSIPRPEEVPARALAQAQEELARVAGETSGRVRALRNLHSEIHRDVNDQNRAAMQPAIDLVRAALTREYDKAMAELAQRVAAGTEKREFPEDPQMRAAFHSVLSRLARSDDDRVYLVFASDNQVDAAATATRPAKPRPPEESIIEPGEAFAPTREARRRRSFEDAMEGALRNAFSESLVSVYPLSEGDSRQGKVIFEAKCTTRRAPGEFTLTRSQKPVGKLFSIEVEWEFSVFDIDGTLLSRNRSRSDPAESFRFQMKRSDPDWSAYSVMMDSAYYNYCREITGRLGMIPPAVQERFTFEK